MQGTTDPVPNYCSWRKTPELRKAECTNLGCSHSWITMTPSLELAKLFWATAHQVQAGASVTLEWGGS